MGHAEPGYYHTAFHAQPITLSHPFGLVHSTARWRLLFVASGRKAQAPRKRPGVNDPSVRIPIERLKPDQVFDVPGAPDWMAIDEDVWVSNEPEEHGDANRSARQHGQSARSRSARRHAPGLAAGFGSLWVPKCGDSTLSRVDLKTGKVVSATLR